MGEKAPVKPSEYVELGRNIRLRVERLKPEDMEAGTTADYLLEISDLQRHLAELYDDIRYGDRETVMRDSVSIATSAFVISRQGADDYYGDGADEIDTFVANVEETVAADEIDVDLGEGRWSEATDLIMDMVSVLGMLTMTLAIQSGAGDRTEDLEGNYMTGCCLIAAYAMIVHECARKGTFRGQVLKDLKGIK